MNAFERPNFGSTPPVVKNLIIINAIMLLAAWVTESSLRIDLNGMLGLYFFQSDHFRPYQIITHMFMHGGISHLFFNMFALWMFGRVLEQVWGSQRFFLYYFVTGIGAVVLHSAVNFIEISSIKSHLTSEQISIVLRDGYTLWEQGKTFSDPYMAKLIAAMNVPVVGASGAVFGVLLAFGMLFPNTQLMLLFPPIPIKAKYFVIGYGVIELFMGVSNFKFDNVAHFAHLGGMLFGFILIKYWNKRKDIFY
jgi:membrane associated rhomboid family serine protease